MRTPVRIGVVGWERTSVALARAFQELPQSELAWLLGDTAPELETLGDDETVDAVALATPPARTYELARRALAAGKHVYADTLIAPSSDQADELVRLAGTNDRQLAAGGLLLFHPAVLKLEELLADGRLGELYYLHASRLALAPDEDLVWSLGGRELPVVLELLGDEPVAVRARGEAYVGPGAVDVVFVELTFATGITAHLHVSRLDANDLRLISLVGSRATAVVEELARERSLSVYYRDASDGGARLGDVVCPRVAGGDPLRLRCERFLARVRAPGADVAAARRAASVVAILEALERSLVACGAPEAVGGRTGDSSKVVRLPVKSR
jgi:predicted dehydrogenase